MLFQHQNTSTRSIKSFMVQFRAQLRTKVLKPGSAVMIWRIQKVELKLCVWWSQNGSQWTFFPQEVSPSHTPICLVTNNDDRWLITASDKGLFSNAKLCEYTRHITWAPEAFNHTEQWDTVRWGKYRQIFSLVSQTKHSAYCTNSLDYSYAHTS